MPFAPLNLLNQVHASRPGFLVLLLSMNVCMCVCVCVCVCVCLRVCLLLGLLITSGMMWCDMDLYNWSNKFYGFYMAAVVDIDSGHDVSIYTCRGNYPDNNKLVLYKPLLHCSKHFKQL